MRRPHRALVGRRGRDLAAGLAVASAWLLLLGAAMGDVLSRLAVPSWGNPVGDGQSAEISRGRPAQQVFVAPEAGLSSVEVWARAAGGAASQAVTLRLFEGQAERPLAQKVIEVRPGAATALRLEFAPVGHSQGQAYRLTVESDAPAGRGMTLAYGPSSTPVGAAASIGGQPVPGSLQFQTGYTPAVRQKVELAMARLAEAVPGLRGGRGVVIGAALLYVGVLSLFVRQIAAASAARGKDGR